jgi:hypothetical protein
VGPYLEPDAFEPVRERVAALLEGPTTSADERIEEFCAAFPADRAHRWVRDLAAELLHYADPERYPLMTRWVWDARANTGVLREIWHGENVDTMRIPVADGYATFLMLREELSAYLTQNGVFRDVLDSLRDDPEGPRIDMEKDLIAHLGSRATILSDNEFPIGPKCERKVVAFEVTDEAKVITAIGKLIAADKDARRREFDGSVIWELVDSQSEVPTLIIETPGVEIPNVPSEPPSRRAAARMRRWRGCAGSGLPPSARCPSDRACEWRCPSPARPGRLRAQRTRTRP